MIWYTCTNDNAIEPACASNWFTIANNDESCAVGRARATLACDDDDTGVAGDDDVIASILSDINDDLSFIIAPR